MSRHVLAALLAVGAIGPSAASAETNGVLARAPYLGVSCPFANSTACDRVGLAVWLRRPARSVEATIGGRHFNLNDPKWSGPADNGLRKMFAGFLQPAGLRRGPLQVPINWAGNPPVATNVRIVVTFADGTQRAVTTKVALSAGWG
jgi:hypothetical protein